MSVIEIWWHTYFAALGGLLANPNHDPRTADTAATQIADAAVARYEKQVGR